MAPHAPFGPKGHGTAAATGFALGALSMAGVALSIYGPAAGGPFGAYVALLAAFHQLEYICVAAYRPDTLSFDCEHPWLCTEPPARKPAITPRGGSLTLRWLCSFRHQPQQSIYHSSCHERGGVRGGIVALSLLDRLVRGVHAQGTATCLAFRLTEQPVI